MPFCYFLAFFGIDKLWAVEQAECFGTLVIKIILFEIIGKDMLTVA